MNNESMSILGWDTKCHALLAWIHVAGTPPLADLPGCQEFIVCKEYNCAT